MRRVDRDEVSPEGADGLPPLPDSGGRVPQGDAPRPVAPIRHADLDRFQLTAPVTLDDLAELQRAVRELAGQGASVEVCATDHRFAAIAIDVRWPSGATVRRVLAVQ